MNKSLIVFIILLFGKSQISLAVPNNLPVPRFVTIKFDEVNARTGPENDCPIEWIFIKKGEPVEITAEYGKWRKIRDIRGEGGWVHSSVVAGKRSVVIIAEEPVPLFKDPKTRDKIIARLSPDLRCRLHKCQVNLCSVTCKSYKGWVERKYLWGIYPSE